MRKFFIQRLVQSVLLFFGVAILVFFLVRLTGDPAALMTPRDAPPEQVAAFREAMGFDRPVLVQLADYVQGVVRGDFGESLRFNTSALGLVLDRVGLTILLATFAMGIAIVVSIPLGILGGMNPNKPFDYLSRSVGLVAQVTPSFWLALILLLLFAVRLGWFPSFGIGSWQHFVLPAVALSVGAVGRLVRVTRSAVLEINNAEFVRTAVSKGLSQRAVASRHVLRNASLVLVSVISVQYTYLLGGAVYIESIFAIPGLGALLEEAIRARDFPLVQAITLFIAAVAIGLSLLSDVVYSRVDPRIRLEA